MASIRTVETPINLPRTQRVELIAFPDVLGENLRQLIVKVHLRDCFLFGSENLAPEALESESLLRCIWVQPSDSGQIYRPRLQGFSIAAVQESDGQLHADLINNGFAAVIDLSKTTLEDAALVICAYAENERRFAQYRTRDTHAKPPPFLTLDYSQPGLEYLAAAVELLDIGVYVLDHKQDEVITVWNREMERLFRLSKEDVIGKPLEAFLDDPHIRSVFSESSEPHTRNRAIFPSKEPSRTNFIADISKTRLFDENDRPTVSIGVIKDITSRIHSENRLISAFNELEASKEKLEQSNIEIRKGIEKAKKLAVVAQSSNKAKSYFLSNISHELRTPLNSIVSLSYALLEGTFGPLSPRQRENLEIVSDSSKHLQSLINDILDLSKIELGKLALKLSPAAIEDVAVSSIRMVEQEAASKDVKCTLSFNTSTRQLVVDAKRLRQILLNLLVNAIKFTEKGTKVELRVEDAPDREAVCFKVIDQGIGINENDFAKIFSPFTQLDDSLSRQYEGTGLGLAIASKFVELHGGGLSVSSEPGSGSTFAIYLPQSAASANPESSDKTTLAELATGKEPAHSLILIVDENDHSTARLKSQLADIGVHSSVVALPNEISAYHDQISPAAVFVDLNIIPTHGSDWIAGAQRLPSWQHTKWIATTSLQLPENQSLSQQLGFLHSLSKPVSTRHIESILNASRR